MVLTESMRLYPPAYVLGREVLEHCEIGGQRIAPGTVLLMSQWAVHRDPRYFPDPEAFRPERWAGDLAARLPRFAYFPFGGGPRLCIGQGFATMEATLVLATIARRTRLELESGRVTPRPYVTLRPAGGIRVRVRKREPGREGSRQREHRRTA